MEFCGFLSLLGSLNMKLGLMFHLSYYYSLITQKEKIGTIINKVAKSCHYVPTITPKSNFFLSSFFSHGVFKSPYDIWIALNGLGKYCPILILNYLFKLIFQPEYFGANSSLYLVYTQRKQANFNSSLSK